MTKRLAQKLFSAVVEKDVENAYREAVCEDRPAAELTSPFGTDGYARWENVRLLLEAKFDLDYSKRPVVCNTLGQCILYLKRFEQSGQPLPNVILVGDKNECFVLSTTSVQNFLNMKIDWSVAPSRGNPELTQALVSGLNLLPYVYNVDRQFDFREVLNKVETLAVGSRHSVRATAANIGAIFTYWENNVLKDTALSAVEKADVFLRCLFDPNDVYIHPNKKSLLVVPMYTRPIVINEDQYRSFFDHFAQFYTADECRTFHAMRDRLIEDDARRRQGAFFTPALWVDEAHKEIAKALGDKWKEECVVWDNSCGTCNLTRDYQFSDLILSTAEKADVDVIREQGYNSGCFLFQYDFLNDETQSSFFEEDAPNVIPPRVQEHLRQKAAEGKRLVFFMNPPYAEDGVAGAVGETRKGVASTSLVARELQAIGMGRTSRQLYAQFMFQCVQVARRFGFQTYTIATFSAPTFLCSGSYRKFRDWWNSERYCQGAFLFQASEFADVSNSWGISFTVWSGGNGFRWVADAPNEVPCYLKATENFAVQEIGTHMLYNSDNRDASSWVGKMKPGPVDTPKFTSGLKVVERYDAGQQAGGLGVFCNMGNNVMKSGTDVYFLSGKPAHKGHCHLDLLPQNWRRCIALYAARKLVTNTWVNHVDEYLAPHTEGTPAYEQWVNDCHVYALLEPKNNCTAMRNVQYKDKKWDITNHFFWLPTAAAREAINAAGCRAMVRDIDSHPPKCLIDDGGGSTWKKSGNTFMAFTLGRIQLSPPAAELLQATTDLWHKSLAGREAYAEANPSLHLTAWDAGWYQLKGYWKEYYPADFEKLREMHKALADILRPGVYVHGFLKE